MHSLYPRPIPLSSSLTPHPVQTALARCPETTSFAGRLEDKLPNTGWEQIETEWGVHDGRRVLKKINKKKEGDGGSDEGMVLKGAEVKRAGAFAIPMKAANSELHTDALWLKCA